MVRLDEGVYRAGDAVTVTLEDADQQEQPKFASGRPAMRSKRFWVDGYESIELALSLDSRAFSLWNGTPATRSDALVMDFDLEYLEIELQTDYAWGDEQLEVQAIDVSGSTKRRATVDFPYTFLRGVSGALAFGRALDKRGLELANGHVRYAAKKVEPESANSGHFAAVAFPTEQNLATRTRLSVRVQTESLGQDNGSMVMILREDDGTGDWGDMPYGDGWASRPIPLASEMKTYHVSLESEQFELSPEFLNGNGRLEFDRVRWVQIMFVDFRSASSERVFSLESLKLSGFRPDAFPVFSEDGIPTLSSSEPDGLVAYPSAELAIRYINDGDFHSARKILMPAARAAWKGRGRLPRRYDHLGNPKMDDATNGDASVMSIAFSRYLRAFPRPVPPWEAQFFSEAEDAEKLLQGWLNGQSSVQTSNHGVVSIDSPLPLVPDVGSGVFRLIRPDSVDISAENETRRAIALWFLNPEEGKALIEAIVAETWDAENAQFRSNIGGEGECARDALSLLILAADGMGLMPELSARLTEAARQMPCYAVDSDDRHVGAQPWFGYLDDAIPEFMYLDAAALARLGLQELAMETVKSADSLTSAINYGYSTKSVEEPSAMTIIMAWDDQRLDLNPYFGR